MATINCANCGAPNEDGRFKCSYCGSAFPKTEQQAAPQPQPMMAQPIYLQPVMMAPGYGVGMAMMPPKSKVAAALLAFFLGWLGVHNFYLGHTGRGGAQLGLTIFLWWTVVVPLAVMIWVLVEFVLILSGGLKDKFGRDLV
jgi:TM2 domain-containing membrane protein YozV